jgi:ATP-binding cassette, subfamily B, bacterial IrtB/YbtQ
MSVATVVGNNVTTVATAISNLSTLFVQIVSVPAVIGVVVLAVDWRLGVVLAVAIIAAIPLVRRIQRLSNAGFRAVDEADADAADRIVEYVQGLPMLKATGQAGADSPRLVFALTHQRDAQSVANRLASVPVAAAQLLVQLAIVALVVVGATLVVDARLTVPLLVAVVVGVFADQVGEFIEDDDSWLVSGQCGGQQAEGGVPGSRVGEVPETGRVGKR